MKLLLDTCTFLWLMNDAPDLSPKAVELFRAAEAEVYVSVASTWEIAVKFALGKVRLPAPPEKLVPRERAARGIESLAIDEESALHVSRLPPLHRDPFDRMIVSQAIVHGLTILTPDPLITQYPARTVW
jgi:PIN domain nuclease of toxin-antitoxin system